eukprot:CAMPEP_0174235874 /NCGR_PEP_ID=MMETSP0417-20130205/5181_1 /TAXON_ID=242541 /ORGANISM="Mayorella sp, Strain BSH-02190019" /LENGTH=608 /DNA_ID=CAMNT_0015314439 /DNA_START=35 /DNA_END=1861 /DNA_ORIENTATION=+
MSAEKHDAEPLSEIPSTKLSTGNPDYVGGLPADEQYSMENLREKAAEQLSHQAKEYKVANRTKETIVIDEDTTPGPHKLFFDALEGCEVVVKAPHVRILIAGCNDCKFRLEASVLTRVFEIWRCKNTTVTLTHTVGTMQMDLNDKVTVVFERFEQMLQGGQVVWAGCYDLALRFENRPDLNFTTGLEQAALVWKDDTLTMSHQFFVRIHQDHLKEERLIRVGGVPTTERELIEFDEMVERNRKKYEEYVRSMLKEHLPSAQTRIDSPVVTLKASTLSAAAANSAKQSAADGKPAAAARSSSPSAKKEDKSDEKKETPEAAASADKDQNDKHALKQKDAELYGQSDKECPDGLCHPVDVSFDRKYDAGVRLREFSNIAVRGAPIIEAFPSISLTSILSCGYLIEQLKLPLVGVISCTRMAPKCVITASNPSHVIRIHGDTRLVVIECEYKLPDAESAHAIVDAILDFAIRHRSSGIITIEGLPKEKVDDYSTLQYLSSSLNFARIMERLGHQPVTSGVIAGITGLMLAEAPLRRQRVACMLSPCVQTHPDPRAAASIIKAIEQFLDDVVVDTTDLEQKADKIEKAIKGLLKENRTQEQLSSSFPENMYL